MSAEPLEPLPMHLRELIALESEAHPVDHAAQAEVRARVELAVQLAGASGARGGTQGGAGAGGAAGAAVGAKKLLAVGIGGLLIGGGAGVVGSNLVRAPAPAPSLPAISATSEVSTAPDVPAALSVPPEAPSAPAAAPAHPSRAPSDATRPAPSSEEPSVRGDLTKERELLDVARAALARSRPGDAIAACEQHAKTWPHGFLNEEREVVLIQALVASGQRAEAERRAAQFRKTFPQSMLLPAVEMALEGGK